MQHPAFRIAAAAAALGAAGSPAAAQDAADPFTLHARTAIAGGAAAPPPDAWPGFVPVPETYGVLRQIDAGIGLDHDAVPRARRRSPRQQAADPPRAERWSIADFADGLAAGSDPAYQVYGGLNITLGGHLVGTLGYRYMEIDYGDERLDIDVDIDGPVLGLTYNF